MINKHACTKLRHVIKDLDYFCKLEIFVQNKDGIFQTWFFQNFSKYKNKIFKLY